MTRGPFSSALLRRFMLLVFWGFPAKRDLNCLGQLNGFRRDPRSLAKNGSDERRRASIGEWKRKSPSLYMPSSSTISSSMPPPEPPRSPSRSCPGKRRAIGDTGGRTRSLISPTTRGAARKAPGSPGAGEEAHAAAQRTTIHPLPHSGCRCIAACCRGDRVDFASFWSPQTSFLGAGAMDPRSCSAHPGRVVPSSPVPLPPS
mmetsp:Transcript_45907/g.111826  ORF Transcript_45907/g.111826 Transcript_45907/m.111826 type:complete len:202 (-) Transcript_45907:29-634(-)